MRAERFGSYSIVRDLAGDADLVAPEVDDAEALLGAAAAVAYGDLALVVAAGLPLLAAASSDFSGFERVISSKLWPVAPRRPGDVGLYCLIAMLYALEQLYLVARQRA